MNKDGVYIYKDGEWQLVTESGSVESVNNIQPDESGNVDLGDIASKQYVDDKIGDVDLSALETKEDAQLKLTEAKVYTDTKTTDMETTAGAQAKVDIHANNTDNPHEVTKAQVGLENVDDIKQMPISGGTFTGIAKAQSNADYTVAQMRNIIYLEDTGEDLDNSIGNDGDMLVVYEAGE